VFAQFEEHCTVFFFISVDATVYNFENVLKWNLDLDGLEVVFTTFFFTEFADVVFNSSFLPLLLRFLPGLCLKSVGI